MKSLNGHLILANTNYIGSNEVVVFYILIDTDDKGIDRVIAIDRLPDYRTYSIHFGNQEKVIKDLGTMPDYYNNNLLYIDILRNKYFKDDTNVIPLILLIEIMKERQLAINDDLNDVVEYIQNLYIIQHNKRNMAASNFSKFIN